MVVRHAVSLFLLLSAVFEGGLGMLQLLGLEPTGNRMYPFTGTFYNPGPFACYLAVVLPVAVYAAGREGRASGVCDLCIKVLAWTALTFAAVLLPSSMSRTAWAAAAAGMAVVFSGRWKALRDVCARPAGYLPACIMAAACLLLAMLLSWGAYRLKQGSADGRFLMWKVSTSAIRPHPFEGVGWQNVAGAYGEAQERYFASGAASPGEAVVADAPAYVFNEYLQVAVAYGWGWSFLMIAVMIAAFVVAFRAGSRGIAGSVAACAVVMAASYPFQFPISILTIGAICIAAFIVGWRPAAGWSTALVIPAVAVMCGTVFLTVDCKKFDQDTTFRTGLALHKSGQWEKSNGVMLDLLPHSSDPMPLNIIGKNYTELNMHDSAEYYLRRAALRCPNRLYPHYLLMKLYLRQPADSAARREAKILLTKKEKVPSPAIEEMRKEAKKIMDEGIFN